MRSHNNAQPHYPADRWEFGQTLEALEAVGHPVRLAEVGAGDGMFLDRLASMIHRPDAILAADFDEGAVRTLRGKGYTALRGSLADVARTETPFDVLCMFQTLEHMADLDAVFRDIPTLLTPTGSVFISVPHADATRFQEEATGYWDMPPNHVGRWTPAALHRMATRHGFTADVVTQPISTREIAWQLAVSGVNARSYTVGTVESRINSLRSRPVRGALKRGAAIARLPRLLARRRDFQPLSCWAHLRRSA